MNTVIAQRSVRAGSAARLWHLRFIAPMLITLFIMGVIPAVYTAYLSVTASDSDSLINREFVGFEPYIRLFADGRFWHALGVQSLFVGGAVIAEIVIGIAIALALNRNGRWMLIFRSVLLAPAVLPTVVVALLFSYLLQSRVGAISYYAAQLGLPTGWFDSGPSALAVLVGIDVWQFTPLVAILVLAGLQGVPAEFTEAALIDGAGPVRRVFEIILPIIAPLIATVSLLRLIDAIQVFPTIYVLTGGGPGESTNALNFWGFTVFFQYRDTTYGSTIAVVLTLGTVFLASVLAFALRRQITPGKEGRA